MQRGHHLQCLNPCAHPGSQKLPGILRLTGWEDCLVAAAAAMLYNSNSQTNLHQWRQPMNRVKQGSLSKSRNESRCQLPSSAFVPPCPRASSGNRLCFEATHHSSAWWKLVISRWMLSDLGCAVAVAVAVAALCPNLYIRVHATYYILLHTPDSRNTPYIMHLLTHVNI